MKTMFKAALLAAAPVAAALAVPQVASAQVVAVADLPGAVQKTVAYTTALTQMRTTYATQIAQIDARQKALQAEINPLVTAFQAAQKANSPQATLQTQYNTIQQKQQAAQAELQRLSLPVARAQAYVEEQITGADGAKLNAALKAAMVARGVQLVVAPQATISYQPGVDITDSIVAELNKTVPSVSITPPANWQPGGQGAAAAPAATPAATTPRPATPPGR